MRVTFLWIGWERREALRGDGRSGDTMRGFGGAHDECFNGFILLSLCESKTDFVVFDSEQYRGRIKFCCWCVCLCV